MTDTIHTDIKELGEFGLIDHLTQNIALHQKSTVLGVGDDCAIIDKGETYSLVSTDMFVNNIHFDLMYTPLKHLGYKCVTASISDIYAMNGKAEQIVVSLAISNQFSVELIEEIYTGMLTACNQYEIDFVGGDTTTILNGLVINVTAIGSVAKDKVVKRGGASKNDLLIVSGDLGAAYTGLLLLEREKEVFKANDQMQPQLEGYDYILERCLKPEARKDIVEILDQKGILPTSMMDISDGLSSEIMHLGKNSGLGCKLFEEKIPIDSQTFETARKLNLDPTTCALNGGEDYELLFTIKPDDFDKIKNDPDFTAIGHMYDADYGIKLITRSGSEHNLQAQGWKVFNKD